MYGVANSTATASFALAQNGTQLGTHYTIGATAQKLLCSISTIVSVTSGDTFSLKNNSAVTATLNATGGAAVPPIYAFMTFVKIN